MKIAKAGEMREIDRRAIDEFGIPGIVLMENAALAVLREIDAAIGPLAGRTVTLLCGPGNNGGDGFAVARHLLNLGADPRVFLFGDPLKLKGDALANHRILTGMGCPINAMPMEAWGSEGPESVSGALAQSSLIVDAIFGTGFSGGLPPVIRRVSRLVAESRKKVLSVDIPTGVDADTGKAAESSFRADITVTFALSKVGLELHPGKALAGRLKRAYIGIPGPLLTDGSMRHNSLAFDEAAALLPGRDPAAHKGNFGKAVIVAGSRGMTGAAYLASAAAVRVGTGIVVLCVPESLNPILEVKTTEAMTWPCPETPAGTFAKEALIRIAGQAETSTALVVGPGLGRNPELHELVNALALNSSVPILIDADGLNELDTESLRNRSKPGIPVVLTPHPGEMARLLGRSIREIEDSRIEVAARCAKDWNAVVLLKGASTVVASPEGQVFINPTGNPGMATGGSGDVLSGIIGGLMAQGVGAVEAAALGAYIHGYAGDLGAANLGMAALSAGDLLTHIPGVLHEMER